ncbi:MAG: cyanophycinase [Alphaproteobacteria bacterium]|nr:cyanophycinase [Alphaproteobacteria bacterium]
MELNRRNILRISLWVAAVGCAERHTALAQLPIKSLGPPNGSLLIIGGGTRGPDIQEAAIRLGRGSSVAGRWVYIPTAAADNEIASATPPAFIARSGATLTVLHTRERTVADTEAFTAPLRAATAVFLDGGRQWRLVDAYAGTRTERELRAVLDRGGLISGTSAGATIQGSYLVRGAPSGNTILMSPGHERGFGYLTNVAIDQHVRARGRETDLAKVVSAHPGLLGIGIDEGTAIIVNGNTMTVIGIGLVFINDGATHDGQPYYALTGGMRFDLASWSVLPGR